jgi:hypothetical protein
VRRRRRARGVRACGDDGAVVRIWVAAATIAPGPGAARGRYRCGPTPSLHKQACAAAVSEFQEERDG